MKRALALAARARGRTSPNPMVGALVVRNGRIVGEGYHRKAGTPHAEVHALDAAGNKAAGAELYVSLEPCCHTDKRTPPCTQKIIRSGIRNVVVAMPDPNPKVAGRGIAELEAAGIRVVSGVCEQEARRLNEAYVKHVTTGLPFVTLKIAMTLDGKIAMPDGESKWITGEPARRHVHRLRGMSDAILTAIGTVRTDDPQLTCRHGGLPSPLRIVIDPRFETPEDSKVLRCPPATILVVSEAQLGRRKNKHAELAEKGIRFFGFRAARPDLKRLMKLLGREGVTSVMIEGGSSLNASCLAAGIVDKVVFYIAPKIIGGKDSITAVGGDPVQRLADAYALHPVQARKIGSDFLIEGYLAGKRTPSR